MSEERQKKVNYHNYTPRSGEVIKTTEDYKMNDIVKNAVFAAMFFDIKEHAGLFKDYSLSVVAKGVKERGEKGDTVYPEIAKIECDFSDAFIVLGLLAKAAFLETEPPQLPHLSAIITGPGGGIKDCLMYVLDPHAGFIHTDKEDVLLRTIKGSVPK